MTSTQSYQSFQSLRGSRLFGRPVSTEIYFIDDSKSPLDSPYDLGPAGESSGAGAAAMHHHSSSSHHYRQGPFAHHVQHKYSGAHKLQDIPESEKIPLVEQKPRVNYSTQNPTTQPPPPSVQGQSQRFGKSMSLDANVSLEHV